MEYADSILCEPCSANIDTSLTCHAKPTSDELLMALKRCAPWLGKMIADGDHEKCVGPSDCVRTLELVNLLISRSK